MKRFILLLCIMLSLVFVSSCREEELDRICAGQLYELYRESGVVCDFIRVVNIEFMRTDIATKQQALETLYTMKSYLYWLDVTYIGFVNKSKVSIDSLHEKTNKQVFIMDYELFGIHLEQQMEVCDKSLMAGLIDKLIKDISLR